MTAREEILRRVRSAQVPAPATGIRRDYSHVRNHDDRLAQFVQRVQDYKATVVRTPASGVAAAVARFLVDARQVVIPPGFDPSWTPEGLDIVHDEPPLSAGELNGIDAVLTCAMVGIAETGTIVLDHTAGMGRRILTLVPDLHVCVVTADQVVGDVPEAIARLSASVKNGRPLTWISGGSATVDIELSRVEGVHGPRTLRVVLVEPSSR